MDGEVEGLSPPVTTLNTTGVMPRLDRGIQYAAASRLNQCRLWNTGSPAFAGDDSSECSTAYPPLDSSRLYDA
jgi:hypothetical protein